MDAFEQAIILLVNTARQTIALTYDKGTTDYRPYHNSVHTTHVIEATHNLSELAITNNHISTREARLCVLAAAFHDAVHNGDSDPTNEQNSADLAEQLMSKHSEFTSKDIKHVRAMILATKCTQKYPKIIQSPREDDYASQLLCDADLASLGKPFAEFYASATRMLHELHGTDPDSATIKKFFSGNIEILSNHTYWTDEARKLFPYTADNCKQLRLHNT